ncbi:MAG TPA: hypothetical protein VM093_05575 [Aeromicrobium sp.]|nr:hypothetical protein [Aeromicrobium sp.]
MSNAFVQIFAVTDARAQELIVGLLRGIRDVAVEAASCGSDCFVITECADAFQAHFIRRIVTSIDFDAKLAQTSLGPAEPMTA